MPRHTVEHMAFDRASVRSIDVDGHLHISESPISKGNISQYFGREIPDYRSLGLVADKIYQVFRDPVELEKAAPSFDGKPLLSAHKPQSAAEHDHEITVGAVSHVRWVKPFLVAELAVWDGESIAAIQDGSQRELSAAYRYTPVLEPGEFQGERYEIRMTDIIGNHVALVPRGRAGPDVVVADAALSTPTIPKQPEKRPMATKRILTRRAAAAKGALTAHLRTALAQDAELDDVIKLLDTLETPADIDTTDPVTPVTEDDDAETAIRKLLGDKCSDEDIAKIVALLPKKPTADEEAAAKAEADRKAAADAEAAVKAEADRKAAEAAAEAARADNDKVTKTAMDAAIGAAVQAAEANTIARLRAARDAEKAVAPWVGTLAIAADSAEAVYTAAFKVMGVDVKDVHPSAFAAILKAQPLPGAVGVRTPAQIAADAHPASDFLKTFPGAARIRAA